MNFNPPLNNQRAHQTKTIILIFRVILRPVIFSFLIYSYLLIITHTLQANRISTLLVPLLILYLPLAAMELLVSYGNMMLYKEDRSAMLRGINKRLIALYIIHFTWTICVYTAPLISHYIYTSIDSFFREGFFIMLSRPWWSFISVLIVLLVSSLLFRSEHRGSFFFSIIIFPAVLLTANVDFNFNITGSIKHPFVEKGLDGAIIYKYPEFKCDKRFPHRLLSSDRFPGVPLIDSAGGKAFLPIGTNLDYSACPNIISFNLDGSGTTSKLVQNKTRPQRKLIRNLALDNSANELVVMPFTDWRIMLMLNNKSLEDKRGISFLSYSEGKLNDLSVINSMVLDAGRSRAFIGSGSPPALIRVSLVGKEGTETASHFDMNDLSVHGVDSYGSLNNLIYDYDNNLIYALLLENGYRSRIIEFNPETLEISREIKIEREISAIELDPDRNMIYAVLKWSRKALVASRTEMKVIDERLSPAPLVPMLKVDPDRDVIYAVDYLRGRLIIMDRDFRRVLRIWNVGNKPRGIDMDNEGVYVASTMGVVKINYALLLAY